MKEVIKKIIACPACKKNLILNEKNNKLLCKNCKRKFDIDRDSPVLI